MANENSGKQLKIFKGGGNSLGFNAWPNKQSDDTYLHLGGRSKLGSVVPGLTAAYEGYNKMINKDNDIGDSYNQAYLQQEMDGVLARAIVDEYAGNKGLGASIGYSFGDGLEAHLQTMNNPETDRRTNTAYMYKYVPGGRLKLEAEKNPGGHTKASLLFNKRF